MSLSAPTNAAPRTGAAAALALAGVSAMLASACCVLPLVFVFVGISGAWISRLQWFEPYSAWLAGLALLSLGIAGWRLFAAEPAAAVCAPGAAAPCRTVSAAARRWFWAVALLTLVPVVVPLLAPWFY